MVTEYLFQWLAMDASKDRICDAGVVWAPDEEQALSSVPLIVGGPHRDEIRHISARKVIENVIAGKLVLVTREVSR